MKKFLSNLAAYALGIVLAAGTLVILTLIWIGDALFTSDHDCP